ncbi:helix-turn-helix domain-containing protein [Flavobacterium sp. MAH-1]|uniref:Helix-turn-helix domain-containing protein n=1 Tax=Flavobacterium agri TaxID=2743471 RepID=A0A7Y8Y2R3_9FLAO|nr:AraC family transcriptional regulator [Flavobacterium agri]NUY81459.1 helix-turn-helix domain-containing protein [Flavobacterium agri]NYA71483.1 helix-turn-helix domain-containing protein [Flavobacterium agri]
MIFRGAQNEYFELETITEKNASSFAVNVPGTLQLLWFRSNGNEIRIDGASHSFDANDIITLSQFHRVEFVKIDRVELLRFNTEFYCVINHDSEVGCKGILYYAAGRIPLVKLKEMDLEIVETAWHMARLEFMMKDDLQLEMLQMMLKRILILCTRIYKNQGGMAGLGDAQNDLVREFNFLVEKHFRDKHSVSEYAELLHKSPKTLTNVLNRMGEPSPLNTIHHRIELEARRLLHYSKKDISEIGYELGFDDIYGFSRFFKKQSGQSPREFRMMAA